MENELIGKCGLYCGACTIYRAERDNESFRKTIALKFNCLTEQVKCNGCGSLTNECWGNECKIVKCVDLKGYKYCYECNEYLNNTCERFTNLSNRYYKSSVDLRDNLQMIKNGEVEGWLEESKKKFSCKTCGNPIISGASTCHQCNSNI